MKGVVGHLEGPDRQRQLHGLEPHRPGAQHRRSRRPRSPTATCRRKSPSTRGRDPGAEEHDQHAWSISSSSFAARGHTRGARSGHRRQAGRPGGSQRRRRHVEGPDRQRQLLAGNLTAQVRNIAEVTTAVANGDLSKKITVDVKGEILELKNTINTMVDQLNSFAVGSDPRRARSRHRRKARRPGRSARASPAPGRT